MTGATERGPGIHAGDDDHQEQLGENVVGPEEEPAGRAPRESGDGHADQKGQQILGGRVAPFKGEVQAKTGAGDERDGRKPTSGGGPGEILAHANGQNRGEHKIRKQPESG